MSGTQDLLALAIVRRLILELGYELRPEGAGTLIGPLELWIHEPRDDLAGQSPLQALFDTDGETMVRDCLQSLLRSGAILR